MHKKIFTSICENQILTPHIELLHISLERKRAKNIEIICIYRPPDGNPVIFINELCNFLNNINLCPTDI